ncbi:DUF3606 domain-containing protein [Rhizobium ruizarguesonis]|nr:DUF3606 domain-containing protein [Rhizobium ruizarguesonis]
MSDNKKSVKQDRKRVAADQPYELYYFKNKHKLSDEQARDIIKKAGNDRDKANSLAEQLKKR